MTAICTQLEPNDNYVTEFANQLIQENSNVLLA